MVNFVQSKHIPSHDILQQAAQWFATINDENVSVQQQQKLAQWLAQDVQHRDAWQFVDSVSQRFSQTKANLPTTAVGNTIKAARKDRLNRRQALQSIAAFGLFSFFTYRYTPVWQYGKNYTVALLSDHHTDQGVIKTVKLADGGQLWLNTASAINVNYSATVRNIELIHGEILISTAKDQQNRAFIVTSQHGQLQALGTRFSVHQQKERTLVAVFEGTVEITTKQGQQVSVEAGQQTSFSESEISALQIADYAREAWSKGLLVADNISLTELVAQISRYRQGYIHLAPEVADLRIMGTYPINNPDHMLTMIAEALPVKISQVMPWWLTIEAL
jgi:transmembrane sensor